MLSWRNNLSAKCDDESFVSWHIPNVKFLHVCQKFDCILRIAHLMEDACEILDARVYLFSLTCWLGVESQSFLEVPLTGLRLLGLFVGVFGHSVLEIKQLAISVFLMEVTPLGDPVDVVGQDCNCLRHPFGSIGAIGGSHSTYKLNMIEAN